MSGVRPRPVNASGVFCLDSLRRPGRHKRGSARFGSDPRGSFGYWARSGLIPLIAGGDGDDDDKGKGGEKGGEGEKKGDGSPGGQTPPKPEEKVFSQAQVDAIVTDRLQRERDKNKADADKAAREAADRAAAEQGEFKKLAEQRQARVTELEAQVAESDAVKAKADRYEAALTAHLETQRKDLPKHVTELLDKLDPVDQLEWIAKHRDELGGGTTRTGPPASPRSNGQTNGKAGEIYDKLRATGSFRPL